MVWKVGSRIHFSAHSGSRSLRQARSLAGRAHGLAQSILDDSVAAWLCSFYKASRLDVACPLPTLIALITTWLASQWQVAGG